MTNTPNSEVISAFVDDEAFEPASLAEALSTGDGRELLIDLIALRHLVTDDGVYDLRLARRQPYRRWRPIAAAAAIVMALGGGFAAGRALNSRAAESNEAAPAPTRVIELRPGVEWQPAPGGQR